jgi:hypothetical protein
METKRKRLHCRIRELLLMRRMRMTKSLHRKNQG